MSCRNRTFAKLAHKSLGHKILDGRTIAATGSVLEQFARSAPTYRALVSRAFQSDHWQAPSVVKFTTRIPCPSRRASIRSEYRLPSPAVHIDGLGLQFAGSFSIQEEKWLLSTRRLLTSAASVPSWDSSNFLPHRTGASFECSLARRRLAARFRLICSPLLQGNYRFHDAGTRHFNEDPSRTGRLDPCSDNACGIFDAATHASTSQICLKIKNSRMPRQGLALNGFKQAPGASPLSDRKSLLLEGLYVKHHCPLAFASAKQIINLTPCHHLWSPESKKIRASKH